jgi:hypothetical protein
MKIWAQTQAPRVDRKAVVPYVFNGKLYGDVEKIITAGEMMGYGLARPLGEMLTSEASRKELVQKVVLDVEIGREKVVPLYDAIYQTIVDANFPKVLDYKWEQYGQVLFTEHLEGQEVRFGSLRAEQGPNTTILGYATGWEFTKEMTLFNQAFTLEMLSQAIGEAHAALENHLTVGSLVSATYASGNKTAYQGTTTDPTWLRLYLSIKKGLSDAAKAKRPASVLVASAVNQNDIEQAIKGGQVGGTVYPALSGISDIVYYDGWEVVVDKKTYTYSGVASTKLYLVRPKRGFKRLVKQDLLVQANMGDITTLVDSQIVADFWQGEYAAIGNNVQEVTIG